MNAKIDVYVINLKSRKDRYIYIKNYLEKYDFLNVTFYEGIEHNEGWKGCTLSHLSLIKYACLNNLPYIIVIEDDFECLLNDNEFKELLEYVINLKDVYIFNGIPSYTNQLKKYKYNDDNYLLIKGAYSSAFMIYYQKSYEIYKSLVDLHPIDVLNQILFKQLIYKKQLGTQIPSISSVSNEYSNHQIHYKYVYDVLNTIEYSD